MAYRYHPEIEGLKVNEDGTEVIYCGESLEVRQLTSTSRTNGMKYVYFNSKTNSVAKLVCECWHGMSENPRWVATRKVKEENLQYANLYWAARGTNPGARNAKRRSNSKSTITTQSVPVIKERLKNGETLNAIAKDYNTSDMTISRIKKQMKNE